MSAQVQLHEFVFNEFFPMYYKSKSKNNILKKHMKSVVENYYKKVFHSQTASSTVVHSRLQTEVKKNKKKFQSLFHTTSVFHEDLVYFLVYLSALNILLSNQGVSSDIKALNNLNIFEHCLLPKPDKMTQAFIQLIKGVYPHIPPSNSSVLFWIYEIQKGESEAAVMAKEQIVNTMAQSAKQVPIDWMKVTQGLYTLSVQNKAVIELKQKQLAEKTKKLQTTQNLKNITNLPTLKDLSPKIKITEKHARQLKAAESKITSLTKSIASAQKNKRFGMKKSNGKKQANRETAEEKKQELELYTKVRNMITNKYKEVNGPDKYLTQLKNIQTKQQSVKKTMKKSNQTLLNDISKIEDELENIKQKYIDRVHSQADFVSFLQHMTDRGSLNLSVSTIRFMLRHVQKVDTN